MERRRTLRARVIAFERRQVPEHDRMCAMAGSELPQQLDRVQTSRLARQVLYAFLLTFIASRVIVFMILARWIPDLYLHLAGTHVHHLNYGIFLLAGAGGYLLFRRPAGRALSVAATIYGSGLGLTFDEFGMWLHLGGSYWQRASFDAVVVIAALLSLIAFSPGLRRLHERHWGAALFLALAVVVFGVLLVRSFEWAGWPSAGWP